MDHVNSGVGKKLLIVEDDFYINDIYQREATLQGYFVIAAFDGEEALSVAKKSFPDVILLDIMLPKVNGLDVLKDLRSDILFKSTPIIIMSNVGEEETIQKALKLGASEYLIKYQTMPKDMIIVVNKYFV